MVFSIPVYDKISSKNFTAQILHLYQWYMMFFVVGSLTIMDYYR